MRRPRKSPERAPSTLERMGGREERTSEIGRARVEAERREAEGLSGFEDFFSGEGRRPAGSRGRARRHPRHHSR